MANSVNIIAADALVPGVGCYVSVMDKQNGGNSASSPQTARRPWPDNPAVHSTQNHFSQALALKSRPDKTISVEIGIW